NGSALASRLPCALRPLAPAITATNRLPPDSGRGTGVGVGEGVRVLVGSAVGRGVRVGAGGRVGRGVAGGAPPPGRRGGGRAAAGRWWAGGVGRARHAPRLAARPTGSGIRRGGFLAGRRGGRRGRRRRRRRRPRGRRAGGSAQPARLLRWRRRGGYSLRLF